jgi:hypothetical protein
MTVDKNDNQKTNNKPGWQKALWFVGLWLAGVLVLATIGGIIKLALG